MAEEFVEGIQPDIGREVCLVKGKNEKYRGYKRDILLENLSERENTMFVCIRCQGIMREVCTSSSGEQFCSSCKKEGEQAHPNLQMDNMILSFKYSCPLIARGCKWLGALGGCQNHLDTCGYVYEACKLRCGVVLQRNELHVHEMDKCPHRIIRCEHCYKHFTFRDSANHHKCPKMKLSCELKCGEIVCRENMAQHLEQECGLVVGMCKLGCGVVLTRNELRKHVTDTCVQRLIICELCNGDFKFCDTSAHLDVCPKMIVPCELTCGVIMRREAMTQHLEVDCQEKEIECPYAKYKCVGLIKRKDMIKHLEEGRIEHLELKLNDFIMEESEINAKQKEKISEQSAMIEMMSQEIKSLKKEVENFTSLIETEASTFNPIKLEWRIIKVPSVDTKKQFLVAGYHLEFELLTFLHRLLVRIWPQSGWYYEELKWPFKANFITRLRSQRDPTNTMVSKSEVIVVEREDFNSYSNKCFNIANIWGELFLKEYFTDGVAQFEIFVYFL